MQYVFCTLFMFIFIQTIIDSHSFHLNEFKGTNFTFWINKKFQNHIQKS